MNKRIRTVIHNFIVVNGATDSQEIISKFANQFNTTKQHI